MVAEHRYQVEIDDVLLECESFEWPRNAWEVLELRVTERMGWVTLTTGAVESLQALYNGARGRVDEGATGLLVQYVEGTGRSAFVVTDWRGNSASFVFYPNDGLRMQEAAVEGDVGYHIGELRLVMVG